MEYTDTLIDTLTECPKSFYAGEKPFYFYPISYGKFLLLGRYVKLMEVEQKSFEQMPFLELTRIYREKQEHVCRFLHILMSKTKDEVFNEEHYSRHKDMLISTLGEADTVKLLSLALGELNVDIEPLKKAYNLNKERSWLEKAIDAKEADKNTYTFFGRSIYGSMFGHLMEKYSQKLDYFVWEISYANLQMLMADEVQTVYLSDKESRKAMIPNKRNYIDADDPANLERIKKALAE